MGRVVRIVVLVLLGAMAASCTSDDEGGSAFRNLGKRGDSDVTGPRADAARR